MIRFGVDEVVQATDLLPVIPLRHVHEDVLALGCDLDVIRHGDVHPVLAAVGIAFADHRPLVLSPDAVWLTIAQGVAQHVRLNGETLRARLVRHTDKKALTVNALGVPTTPAGWASVVGGLRALLAREIGDGRARMFECDFSTSSPVDLLASQIVLLDAHSTYFSYHLSGICGIPTITLTGTVEDWRKIRQRIDILAELDLDVWCASLGPIADQFVRAAAGDVDLAFWRRIYNPIDAYGGPKITGWVTRLYPYVKAGGSLNYPNAMLTLPIDEPKQWTKSNQDHYAGPGLFSSSVPATVSRVDLNVVDHMTSARRIVNLVAGVTAVVQDPDGALRPIATWRIEEGLPTRIDDVLERIARDHVTTPTDPGKPRPTGGSADMLAFQARFDTVTLFTGENTWRFRSRLDHLAVEFEGIARISAFAIADLPDGKMLCVSDRRDSIVWIICRVEPATYVPSKGWPTRTACRDAFDDLQVYAGSLADVLTTALDHGGDISTLRITNAVLRG